MEHLKNIYIYVQIVSRTINASIVFCCGFHFCSILTFIYGLFIGTCRKKRVTAVLLVMGIHSEFCPLSVLVDFSMHNDSLATLTLAVCGVQEKKWFS